MTTDIELSSMALVSIGANEMQSFNEGSTESQVASSLYPMVRDAMLSSHPWNFATAQFDLNRLADAPLGDYDYQFQLPAATIRVMAASDGVGRSIKDFRIEGTKLLANAENVRIVLIHRPPEANFPPHFVMALVRRLAAEFCIPMTESTTRWSAMSELAKKEIMTARNIDSQQDTPQAFTEFPLWTARGGTGTIEPSDA